jgi:hypothetical protein
VSGPPSPKHDGLVESPISALRFIPLSLRRTERTPRSTGFARLELGLFTKPSGMMTFYESIKIYKALVLNPVVVLKSQL